MANTQQSQSQDGSLGRDVLYALRYYLGSRRGLLALAGIAPILISVLPCLAMCALGLCMNKVIGGSCAAKQAADPDSSDMELQNEHAEAPPPDTRRVPARRDTQING
mgnify:CR=1 FL=1